VGRLIVALVVVTGCGFKPSVGGDGGVPGGDADADANPDADGSIAPATCLPSWVDGTIRFATPTRIAELYDPSGFERDPSLLGNEKTIFFSSNRTGSQGGSDVFVATRTSVTATFGTPTVYGPASSTNGEDNKLTMTSNELAFIVASTRTPSHGMGTDVWTATRATTAATFSTPTQAHLDSVNTNDGQEDPAITDDLLRLYVAPTNASPQHIAFSSRANAGANFSAPAVIAELDSGAGDADPAPSKDELLIVFSSTRGGGMGGSDLWYATRATSSATWNTPMIVPDVNGGGNDGDPFLSANGCRLYFASDTLGQGFTLWQAVAR